MIHKHEQIKLSRSSRLTFEELYDEISHDWQHKAQQLYIRRSRLLKQALRGDYYKNHPV